MKLQKIIAVFIQHGKVGCYNDVLRPDRASGGPGLMWCQLQHPGVFMNGQPPGQLRQEFQWMKLSLTGKADPSDML